MVYNLCLREFHEWNSWRSLCIFFWDDFYVIFMGFTRETMTRLLCYGYVCFSFPEFLSSTSVQQSAIQFVQHISRFCFVVWIPQVISNYVWRIIELIRH